MNILTVTDNDARVRAGPSGFKWDGRSRIPLFTRVQITNENGKHVQVSGLQGRKLGWTTRSNLTRFFKDSDVLQQAPMLPAQRVPGSSGIARTYNRLGGIMSALAKETKINVPACLAVWMVESAGRRHQQDKAVIRFENHLLFRTWGDEQGNIYNKHFQHGGHNGVRGKVWKNHKAREKPSRPFLAFHGTQSREYGVLEIAKGVAGEATALQCISIGGPQILVSNHKMIGYRTPVAMYDAFQADERSQVLGFFDFCQKKTSTSSLLEYLRTQNWTSFAAGYNGSGQAERYGGLIRDNFEKANQLLS